MWGWFQLNTAEETTSGCAMSSRNASQEHSISYWIQRTKDSKGLLTEICVKSLSLPRLASVQSPPTLRRLSSPLEAPPINTG